MTEGFERIPDRTRDECGAEKLPLPPADVAALWWSNHCNALGIGFLGPTVKRRGPLGELAHLVAAGLLQCDEDERLHGHRDPDKCGYWITGAGREALSDARERTRHSTPRQVVPPIREDSK